MKDILVFFGGVSSEHDISVITGVFTTNAVDKSQFNAIPIYIHNDGKWYSGEALKDISFFKSVDLKKCQEVTVLPFDSSLYSVTKKKLKKLVGVSAAISCLHGLNGEDGAICGLLQMARIPLASPNMFCSSLSMDKWLTKVVLKAIGILTVPALKFEREEFFSDREAVMLEAVNRFKFPIIVKPVNLGSSIGIEIARDFLQLEKAIEKAFSFDNSILLEKYLVGASDINCAVYKVGKKLVVSECEKPITPNDILTFDDKYLGTKSSNLLKEFPAKISEEISGEIKKMCAEIYHKLGFYGIIRIDFLICKDKIYLNEINSVPGSLAYYLFCEKIAEFTELLTNILNDTISRGNAANSLQTEFKTNVLSAEFFNAKK